MKLPKQTTVSLTFNIEYGVVRTSKGWGGVHGHPFYGTYANIVVTSDTSGESIGPSNLNYGLAIVTDFPSIEHCSVSNTNILMTLPSVLKFDLPHYGDVYGETDIPLNITCSDTASADISYQIDGIAYENSASILKTQEEFGAAQGIGIELLRDGRPIEFKKKYTVYDYMRYANANPFICTIQKNR